MSDRASLRGRHREYAFLDANVIRGQLTNDILMTLAEHKVYAPFWSQPVLDEMRRNRPPGVSEEKIDRRIATMNDFFPDAMVSGFDELTENSPADPKDKHVLAAAVQSKSDVLVTENTKDFHAPTSGPYAMRVERLSQFLNRHLDERPAQVISAMQTLVDRNRRDPRTMSALIDKMADQQELRSFANKLNGMVPPEQRGNHEALAPGQRAALDGIAPASEAATKPPSNDHGQRQQAPQQPNRDRGVDR